MTAAGGAAGGVSTPVEQGHAREGERREPRAERLRPKVLSPAEDARHVVPGAERQDGHRGAVGRVELLHLAEHLPASSRSGGGALLALESGALSAHPRHGAVSAADQDAVLRVALAKRAQRLARRHVLQVDHLERGLAAVGPTRRVEDVSRACHASLSAALSVWRRLAASSRSDAASASPILAPAALLMRASVGSGRPRVPAAPPKARSLFAALMANPSEPAASSACHVRSRRISPSHAVPAAAVATVAAAAWSSADVPVK